jgi:aspartyl-tRNA(Asn)/glutamyl-tRNA(Gln) amidotransferase subunit A
VVSSRRVKPAQEPVLSFALQPRAHPVTLETTSTKRCLGPVGTAFEKLESGEISCKELLGESLVRVFSDDCNAFAELMVEQCQAEARAMDEELAQGHIRGVLHGIPITIKDVLDVAGVPTRAGSEAYYEVPEVDAPAVARLRAAGANIIGKTTAHEFALGLVTPQSRNPFDSSRVPGGSSGGSAIAVARGMGLASLGTDTRGSIRVPAALCGVVGLKPTFGLVPGGGVFQLSWFMDHIGPLTASVSDAALITDVLAGTKLFAACGADLSGLRVGVSPDSCLDADGRVVVRFTEAVRSLSQVAGSLVEVARPSTLDFNNATAAALVASRSEAASYHRRLGLDLTKYWPETRALLEAADSITAVDYLDAQRLRGVITEQILKMFEEVDVIVMPTVLIPAPLVEDATELSQQLGRNTTIWSFIGFPAMSVPCGTTPDGLPVGLQMVAPPYEEASLVALGAAFESEDKPSE